MNIWPLSLRPSPHSIGIYTYFKGLQCKYTSMLLGPDNKDTRKGFSIARLIYFLLSGLFVCFPVWGFCPGLSETGTFPTRQKCARFHH